MSSLGSAVEQAAIQILKDVIVGVVEKALQSNDPRATAEFEAMVAAHKLLVEHGTDLALAAKHKAGG